MIIVFLFVSMLFIQYVTLWVVSRFLFDVLKKG